MKIAGYILAFYLIALATFPCCTIDNCARDKTELAAEHESGDDDCGACSPFFNCEGCAAVSIAYEPAAIEIAAFDPLVIYTDYISLQLPRIAYDFWQPPRLG